MFELSSTLVRPENTLQRMWRYLSAARLQNLLETQELFFSHLPIQEDALEGALTERSREHLANWFQHHDQSSREQAYLEVDEYQKAQQYFYVNCWHMNNYESYLMWKVYANRGFAIQTTFERLQASLNKSNAVITGGVVNYVDFKRDITPVGNVFDHVATKDKPYQDEREFRLVYWDIDPRNAGYPKTTNGVRVKVDISMLIESIIRSPFTEPMSPDLENLIGAHGFHFDSSGIPIRQIKSVSN
jgi:hypothetical protein